MKEVSPGVYIGDQIDAEEVGHEFDHVLTLNNHRTGPSEHPPQWDPPDEWVGLEDGYNDQGTFDHAVRLAKKMITADGSTLIHCTAGVSRSATVTITAIADLADRPFEDVRQDVWEKKRDINPNPALVTHAREYLGEIE